MEGGWEGVGLRLRETSMSREGETLEDEEKSDTRHARKSPKQREQQVQVPRSWNKFTGKKWGHFCRVRKEGMSAPVGSRWESSCVNKQRALGVCNPRKSHPEISPKF